MVDSNNTETEFDQMMSDPEFKEKFDEEYAKFEAREQLLELMEEAKISVLTILGRIEH